MTKEEYNLIQACHERRDAIKILSLLKEHSERGLRVEEVRQQAPKSALQDPWETYVHILKDCACVYMTEFNRSSITETGKNYLAKLQTNWPSKDILARLGLR